LPSKEHGEISPKAFWLSGEPVTRFLTLNAKRQLRKAIIPAAGQGTRVQTLTNGLPKELLPISGRPMISFAVQEAALSGLEELFIVINNRKKALRCYLESDDLPRDIQLESRGQTLSLPCLTFIDQPIPAGSGEAIYRVRGLIGDEPFALLMPDFIFLGDTPALSQMIPFYERFDMDIVGLMRIRGTEAEGFGNVGIVEGQEREPGVVAISTLSDKLPGTLILNEGEVVFKAIARWILGPHFIAYLERTKVLADEWDDTPALRMLCAERKVMGKILAGKGFDVGNPVGYAKAQKLAAELDAHGKRW
jgi:UTP--glucose-1-phosphate uridylyltransferase